MTSTIWYHWYKNNKLLSHVFSHRMSRIQIYCSGKFFETMMGVGNKARFIYDNKPFFSVFLNHKKKSANVLINNGHRKTVDIIRSSLDSFISSFAQKNCCCCRIFSFYRWIACLLIHRIFFLLLLMNFPSFFVLFYLLCNKKMRQFWFKGFQVPSVSFTNFYKCQKKNDTMSFM